MCFNTTRECRDQSQAGLPRGEELAELIATALRQPGDVDADSWSWFFHVKFGVAEARLHVAWQKDARFEHIRQEWVAIVEQPAKPGIIGRLFGAKQVPASAEGLIALTHALHRVLQDEAFSNVRWFREDEWFPESGAAGAVTPEFTAPR